ncbi:MAG: squalene-hopene/tetraprenyl-beta-curcumene cyclase [Verrucomicrobiales bacterium]|jgi:squalene-hopene/tetraprenyl-beta-curcumene cyclase
MKAALESALTNARAALLAERNEAGHWEGELSTSALSTAAAIVALHGVDLEKNAEVIAGGANWLIANQNEDGGWGDTTLSFSNISTTLLCWSALTLTAPAAAEAAIAKAAAWIEADCGKITPRAIAKRVTARYGRDRTFAVPILMCCAICGCLGPQKQAWKRVLQLPFELSAFPHKFFAALRLPVVSYALPALIAIGYARFHHAPSSRLSPLRSIRKWVWPKASKVLAGIQPSTGGFLEATPLTSFVTMALASADEKSHPVVENGVRFLRDSVRPDGSWPIDTNLATWTTTLSVKALLGQRRGPGVFPPDRERVRKWLADQQYREIHPYTNAAPGGWAWTDLPGGVPDADDTPGALLALDLLDPEATEAAENAVTWLLDLQNGDGGIPTFCRGWGAQPFDRSSPDLTAHTLRAWHVWQDRVSAPTQSRIQTATDRALRFLRKRQGRDGAWTPLWFGNQHVEGELNKIYGTAMVLLAMEALDESQMFNRGAEWVAQQQNIDGGWGGELGAPSTIEETALAVDALASSCWKQEVESGVQFLIEKTKNGTSFPPQPIGFYFAKLWYYEKLYPVIWTVSAMERVRAQAFQGRI